MAGKQVTELDALPSFTDNSLLPVHNGAGLKKGLLSQLVNYLGTKFSNPNLLTNPDFKINQRGASSYTSGYTVDRWRIYNATLNVSTLALSNPNSAEGYFLQSLENKPTGTFTVTLNVASVTGKVVFLWQDGDTPKTGVAISKGVNTYTFTASNLTWVGIRLYSGASVQLSYMKLEQGAVATSYIAPNPVEEYPKCQRYFQYIPKLYCVPLMHTRNMINSSDKYFQSTNGNLPTEMRIKPTLKYKAIGQSDGSTFADNASFELDSKSINTVTLSSVVSNFSITVNEITLDAEIY